MDRKIIKEISIQESRLLDIIRKTHYGEVKIVVTEGNPVRIEEIKKSIKL
ncbi:MAG: DUF2292 domain-containing protein [Eubacteriales bacterium]|nr:DUF2292 domain-containing protein [Eubacteriales bacterium]